MSDIKQQGFTLIELIMVIVILGILAAIALPKFLDLSTEASAAAVKGVAGSIASASAVNYAGKKAGSAAAQTLNQANVCDAGILGGLLEGGLPTGYTVSGTGDCSAATTTSVECTLTEPDNSETAAIRVICAQ